MATSKAKSPGWYVTFIHAFWFSKSITYPVQHLHTPLAQEHLLLEEELSFCVVLTFWSVLCLANAKVEFLLTRSSNSRILSGTSMSLKSFKKNGLFLCRVSGNNNRWEKKYKINRKINRKKFRTKPYLHLFQPKIEWLEELVTLPWSKTGVRLFAWRLNTYRQSNSLAMARNRFTRGRERSPNIFAFQLSH